MDGIYALLARASLCMPFDPTIEVTGIDAKSCFVFNSNALPLRLAFNNLDPSGKKGEDVRVLADLIGEPFIYVVQLNPAITHFKGLV